MSNIKPASPPLLLRNQMSAASPDAHKWVSASAGTGKTKVLVARLIRLLLGGVSPDSILCLTFTKAGAAEMANRIRTTLASWVRMPDADLRMELTALGVSCTPDVMTLAPTLFVRMIDAPGAGLRIQTIHSFSQSLLKDFPMEAGLMPGFRAMDDGETALTKQTILSELLENAEAPNAPNAARQFLVAIQGMAERSGEEKTLSYVFANASSATGMDIPDCNLESYVRHLLGLPPGDWQIWLEEQLANSAVDAALAKVAAAASEWKTGTATVEKMQPALTGWQVGDISQRTALLPKIHAIFTTNENNVRDYFSKGMKSVHEEAKFLSQYFSELANLENRIAFATYLAQSLFALRHFAQAYAAHKQALGLADYDDLIRNVEMLLKSKDIGPWIQFKLDTQIDHILVDEAQDTNANQWEIVKAITDDFFAGEGQKAGRQRTLFVVGDFKQAIFSFQGSSPHAFEAASHYFEERAAAIDAPFDRLDLGNNFRTTRPILSAVDAVLAQLGPAEMGMDRDFTPHIANRDHLPGRVILWPLVCGAEVDATDDLRDNDENDGNGDGNADEDPTAEYIEKPAFILAENIARQIRHWIDHGLDGRSVQPGDIMVLLRKRTDIAALIVAKLYNQGVAVEGVDRLLLKRPIVVQDLLVAARFAVQPNDDLSLAALLTSPLIGWGQDQLMEVAAGRDKGVSLREAINRRDDLAETKSVLDSLLNMADFVSPYRFFETILSGPMQGRRTLLARLGEEARDPMDALLNQALAFAQDGKVSLVEFLHVFDSDDREIKRESGGAARAVRVMTVHGSKGLEAPIIILADAAIDPDSNKNSAFEWEITPKQSLPMPNSRSADRFGPLAQAYEAHKRKLAEENWRLMYVAMTRARDVLCVAGSIKAPHKDWTEAKKKGETTPDQAAPPNSWYRRIAALAQMPEWWPVQDDSAIWSEHGQIMAFGDQNLASGDARKANQAAKPQPQIAMPAWLYANVQEEPRPPRPLAPSLIIADQDGEMPAMLSNAPQVLAQRRGIAMHRLFELLPNVAQGQRAERAAAWLQRHYPDLNDQVDAMIVKVMQVLEAAEFAALFGPESLPEVPIAAVVGGRVISGQVDRLLVTTDRVTVIDYKTSRFVPASLEKAPQSHIKQMVAYVAALETIFPNKAVDAGLLYTSGPSLLMLQSEMINALKQDLFGANISLSAGA
jgi:ATP-dependent helicase/nuclease subunit A